MAEIIEPTRSPFERAAREGLVGEKEREVESSAPVPNIPTGLKRPQGSPTADKQSLWVEPFLNHITAGATINAACKAANVHPTTVYQRRRTDKEFAAEWNQAAEISTKLIEQEVQRRAVHGTEDPVFYKGEICGHIRRYSDLLAMFLLKARKPDKYRDGADSVRPPTNLTIQVGVVTSLDQVSPDSISRSKATGGKTVDSLPSPAPAPLPIQVVSSPEGEQPQPPATPPTGRPPDMAHD